MASTTGQWYEVYGVYGVIGLPGGREYVFGVTRSRYAACKLARELGGKVRKIPTPKTVAK